MQRSLYNFLGTLLGGLVVGGTMAFFLLMASSAIANPSNFAPVAQTATATTSPTYMTAGTATTTLVYDSYGICGTNQVNIGNTFASAEAVALVQFAGSSTSAVLNMRLEYSDNCTDWYQNELGNRGGFNIASTSNTVNNTVSLNNLQNFSYTFASTTQGNIGVSTSSSATSTMALSLPTPTRAVRVIFSLAAGSTNGAVWARITPKKENP